MMVCDLCRLRTKVRIKEAIGMLCEKCQKEFVEKGTNPQALSDIIGRLNKSMQNT